jgi:protein-tyrosine phosphatase
MFDPSGQVLQAYLDAGISRVVMLTPIEEVLDLTGIDLVTQYQMLGFNIIHAPIQDFSAPAEGALQVPIQQALDAARLGENIVIHCHAGLGRTGLFAACLAKLVFDFSGEEAFGWVRQHIPNAIENGVQIAFINRFRLLGD